MSNEFIGLPTAVGQQKIAAAIGGTALNPTVIRVGDGNGAPITPNTAMTDLVRRVGTAYPITASGRDPVNPTHWRFGAVIPAADGPFDIREIGLFDGAGDMLAISRHVLVEKRSPAQGAAVELYTEFVVPISETAQVAVAIQPTAAVSIFQLLSAGFCTIKSGQVSAPPGNPAIGDLYIVAAAPTGAWAGLTNRLVQWTGSVWVSVDPQPGFVVVAQDRAIDHAERWLRRVVAGWESARAAEDALGLIELATAAEVLAGVDAQRAVTPASLLARIATDAAIGLVRRATSAEVATLADVSAFVTPDQVRAMASKMVVQVFDASGTWVCPDGVRFVFAEAWGAGAGGGSGNGSTLGGYGGGGGLYGAGWYAVVPGTSYIVTVGIGGASSNAAGNSGVAGGSSSFGALLSAGGGGAGGHYGAQPGAGGTSSAGAQIVVPGGGAFIRGDQYAGSAGGLSPLGASGSQQGNSGLQPGGGAAGNNYNNYYAGQKGGNGRVKITYVG